MSSEFECASSGRRSGAPTPAWDECELEDDLRLEVMIGEEEGVEGEVAVGGRTPGIFVEAQVEVGISGWRVFCLSRCEELRDRE